MERISIPKIICLPTRASTTLYVCQWEANQENTKRKKNSCRLTYLSLQVGTLSTAINLRQKHAARRCVTCTPGIPKYVRGQNMPDDAKGMPFELHKSIHRHYIGMSGNNTKGMPQRHVISGMSGNNTKGTPFELYKSLWRHDIGMSGNNTKGMPQRHDISGMSGNNTKGTPFELYKSIKTPNTGYVRQCQGHHRVFCTFHDYKINKQKYWEI